MARWHQDSDRWVWRVYDAHEVEMGKHPTKDIYIVPLEDGWWLIDSKLLVNTEHKSWIQLTQEGKAQVVAGPFTELNDAKAAWRVIYS